MARFVVLEEKGKSLAQRIGQHHLDLNPAQFGYETYYPAIAVEYDRRGGFNTEMINRFDPLFYSNSFLERYHNVYRRQRPLASPHYARLRLADLIPERIWVGTDKEALLRFLSFHTLDYRDNIAKDEQFMKNLTTTTTATTSTIHTITTTTAPCPTSSVIVASRTMSSVPTDRNDGWITIQRRRIVTTASVSGGSTNTVTTVNSTSSSTVVAPSPYLASEPTEPSERIAAAWNAIMDFSYPRDPIAVRLAVDNLDMNDPEQEEMLYNLM